MRVLKFRDLPFYDSSQAKDYKGIKKELDSWAGIDIEKYSMGFLIVEGDEHATESYYFQIGCVENDALVITRYLLDSIAMILYKAIVLPYHIKAEARFHVEQYFKKIKEYAPWGEQQYYYLTEKKDRTPIVLNGPHKTTGMRSGQKRWVVKDDDGELVIGPIVS